MSRTSIHSTTSTYPTHRPLLQAVAIVALSLFVLPQELSARPNIRQGFFDAFPSAVGTQLDTLPNNTGHCGVCHYDFNGGGTKNPYGDLIAGVIGNYPNTDAGRRDAVLSISDQDADGDSFISTVEVTETVLYSNTPTFPGLTPGNVGSVSNIPVSEIQDYLVPVQGGDITPPSVTVIAPNGSEVLTANTSTTVQWTATDTESGVAAIDLYVSLDNGATFDIVNENVPQTGSYTWFPANRPTTTAIFRVVALDNALNIGMDDSDAVFEIASPPGGAVPSTLRDFDMPGSQPFESGVLNPPSDCAQCHGNYDPTVEPFYNWKGSMMAHASIDPLFEASLAIANQDAPDSGDLCLRCHISRGWHQGRSVPTSGTQMLDADLIGVACDLCHRMVDPNYVPENPIEDQAILAALSFPGTEYGNGMVVIDPTGARRGPFVDATSGHPILVSPFHQEAAICGTCHDVSNPAFERDEFGNYLPNAFDAPATDFSPHNLGPVERTYSEWLHSAYNSPQGVYAPEFGGNKSHVSTCQDCHMRDVTGQGCNLSPPIRDDLPLHDMTGGSTWLPGLLSSLHPDKVDPAAIASGIERARYMLQNAAELEAVQQGSTLRVKVTNNTGHKLPTGYPEGRRMWLNVEFYDAGNNKLSESGHYDSSTGHLTHDAEVKIYEIEPATKGIPGFDDGTLFHFVLNNDVIKDNRIPPRGFTNASYDAFGGAPVGHTYEDGQYWDYTYYTIPPGTASVEVELYYQSTSKEFIEFLQANNMTNNAGQIMYDLWNNNGKCPPEEMAGLTIPVDCADIGDFNRDCYVTAADFDLFDACRSGPMLAHDPGCEDYDLDLDGDVDQTDYGLFQPHYTITPDCFVDSDCDDGLYCNGVETCNAGVCEAGTPVDCSSAGDQCNTGTCDETGDTCIAVPVSDGTACDDGDACAGDTCQAGVCEPNVCESPFTLLSNGVIENQTGNDYYTGSPFGSLPMDDLRTTAEEQDLGIGGNNVNRWWEARFEDLGSGTVSDVQAVVQLRREDALTGDVVIEVYRGGALETSQTVPTANIVSDASPGSPPTQVVVDLPTLTGLDVSAVNDLTIRIYIDNGNNKTLWWSYAEVTGIY